jgi:hypothetical protein
VEVRHYDSGMDPTIAGALIGGGAAVLGFGASAWQNAVSLRASQRAAVEQRLWEKRSAIYEQLLEVAQTADIPVDGVPEALVSSLRKFEASILGYASDQVHRAFGRTLILLQGVPPEHDEVAINLRGICVSALTSTIRAELQRVPDPGVLGRMHRRWTLKWGIWGTHRRSARLRRAVKRHSG